MELIADALLIAGAAGAALYCRALSQRLNKLKDLDSGLGAAIAALSRQVDELRDGLASAKTMTSDKTREMVQLTARAEMAAGRLELLLASLHEGGRRQPVAEGESALEKRRAALREAERDDPATRLEAGSGEAAPEEAGDAPGLARRAEEPRLGDIAALLRRGGAA